MRLKVLMLINDLSRNGLEFLVGKPRQSVQLN
jgi:hypothetical protein